jgi:hypothetical protein
MGAACSGGARRTAHVVRRSVNPRSRLAEDLHQASEEDDLPLRVRWECIPLVTRAARRADLGKGVAGCDVPGPVYAGRLHQIAHEAEHRHAPMLDLRLAEPADGLCLILLPQVALEAEAHVVVVGETERVPIWTADGWRTGKR